MKRLRFTVPAGLLIACFFPIVVLAQEVPLPVKPPTQKDPTETSPSDPLNRDDVEWPEPVDMSDPNLLEGSRAPEVWLPLFAQPVTDKAEQINVGPVRPQGESRPKSAPSNSLEGEALQLESSKSAASSAQQKALLPGGPVANDDAYVALAGETLSIAAPGFLANDIDLDGEAISATFIPNPPDNGSLTAFASGLFTYTPDAGFTGTDQFTYEVQDASGNEAIATVTIEVVEANRPPIALDDFFAVIENTTLSIAAPGLLANDVDLDGEAISATFIPNPPDNGSLTAFASGLFTYTPDAGFTGTDQFTYEVQDASGNEATATVTISVLPGGGTLPVANDDAYVALAGETLSVPAPGFLANDIDLDGEAISATFLPNPPDNGSLTAFASGLFTYTPDAGFTGTDQFTYEVQDASGNEATATVTIEVVEGNRTPIANDDAYTALAGMTLSVPAPGFLANDIDLDGEAISATFIPNPPDNGSLTAFASGLFTYTPDAGFTGTDSFTYEVQDASGNEATATVTIEVVEANRPPIALDDFFATIENTVLSVPAPGFLGNDVDLDGEAISATFLPNPPDNGTVLAFASGLFTYTPDAGFTGTDSFTYEVQDASGNEATATVTINVFDPLNPMPAECSATMLAETVGQTSTGAGQVTATFSNPDGITAVTFTLLENFIVTSADLIDVGGDRWEASGEPLEVTATLIQDDLSVSEASYFALVESVCPNEPDGTLETDFDPPYEFEVLPQVFTFEGNYPNPFRGHTTLQFALPEASDVTLSIYDVMGRRVATLVEGQLPPGIHDVVWEGRGHSGQLASGLYFARLDAGGRSITRRLTIVR